MTCDCGHDYDRSPGGTGDYAFCLYPGCQWFSRGIDAEHEATHHYQNTGHNWHLQLPKEHDER